MDPTTLSLNFCVARNDPMSTLEAVLATARRGGLTLTGFTYTAGDDRHSAAIEVQADDANRLELFVLRLGNVIDISNVTAHGPASMVRIHTLHNLQKCPTLLASHEKAFR